MHALFFYLSDKRGHNLMCVQLFKEVPICQFSSEMLPIDALTP